MFSVPSCLKSVSSGLHQVNSNGSPPPFSLTLSILQISKNIRMLISLPFGCVRVWNVFRFVHLCVCRCVCVYVQIGMEGWRCLLSCVQQSQCAIIQYSNAPVVLLHQGNTESSSITASLCFTNCSSLHRLRARLIIRPGEIPFGTAKWTQTPPTPHPTPAWFFCNTRLDI